MKIKGVNAFEQHVEKLLLLVVAVALLGVLAMQFMTEPNAVDVGNGEKVPPKAIFENLASRARGIDGQLVDDKPNLPEVSSVDLKASYESKLVEPVAPADRLAVAFGVADQTGGVLGDLASGSEAIGPSGPIVGLQMPALSGVYANSQWNTIDPYAVQQSPLLARFVTSRQPYDFASVSVQTILDGTKLREALTSAPEGQRQIPRKFWSSTGIAVMAVQVERQRLDEGGNWVADGKAVPMPGTIQPSWYVKGDESQADFAELISKATMVSESVMRPSFPATISGPTWLPPVQAAKRLESYANMGEIKQLEARIASLLEDIDRLQNPGAQSTRTTTTTQDPGGFRGAPGGGRTAPTTRDPSTTSTTSRDAQIQRKQEQIEDIRKQIDDLKFTDGDAPAGTTPSDPGYADPRGGRFPAFGSTSGRSGPTGLLDSDSVPLWTHDLAVKPGETYRYRVRIGVNNPLFGKGSQLDEGNAEHARLAKEPISYTPWTEWSEPVLVGARDYFFVTNGSTSGLAGTGAPRATGEIYTMHYGYYRKASVQLAPGDPVRGEARAPEGLVAIDTTRVERGAAIQALAEYQKSLGREDVPAAGFANTAQPGGFPTRGDPGRGGYDPTISGTTTSGTNQPFKLPDGMTAMEGKLNIGLGVILLDVSEWPLEESGARSQTRVYLRQPNGKVQVVTPGQASTAYALVTQSDTLASDAWIDFSGTDPSQGAVSGVPTAEPNPFGPAPDSIWGG